MSPFGRVLHVDPQARTAVAGGMTTYEDLVDATLAHGLMPLVVPELKTITLGGAVTGLGVESTSLRNGLPHESVTALEILTGDGRVITATEGNEHGGLFRGFPNSYGTLGYALSLTIELEPVKPFVHLRHFRFGGAQECMDAVAETGRHRQLPRAPGRLRGRHGVRRRRNVPHRRRVQRRRALGERLHPAAHVLPVHPRTAGGLPDHPRLPVAVGHRLVLVLAGVRRAAARDAPRCGRGAYRRSDVYRKLVAFDQARGLSRALDARRGLPPREKVIQDVEIPLDATAEFLAFFAEQVGMSPVWLCPLRLRSPRPWPLYPLRPGQVYVNIGFWGTRPLPPGRGDGYYNRLIEEKVGALGGHKGLYSTSFYSEDEFWMRYNGRAYPS